MDALKLHESNPFVYQMATDVFGCTPVDILFFSSNNRDIAGLGAFDLTAIWVINTDKGWNDLPARPTHLVHSPRAVLDLVLVHPG